MESYNLFDIFWPWVALLSLLWLIGSAEDWIHKHFYGIGRLLTQNEVSATRLFYVFFAPGVLIHEFVQYIVAGALNIPIKKGFHWPEEQLDGSMRLNFVVIQRDQTNLWRAMCFAASPFLVMGLIVWHISTQRLDLHDFTEALGTADLNLIWAALKDMTQKTGFLVWFYLLFTIANTMVPNRSDAEGLPLIGMGFIALTGVMLVYGVEGALVNFLGGRVANTLTLINTALVAIFAIDVLSIGALWAIEGRLSAWRGQVIDYGHPQLTQEAKQAASWQPGSAVPLPVGTLLPSIYNFELPLPDANAAMALAPTPAPVAVPRTTVPKPASERTATSERAAARPTLAGQSDAPARPVAPSTRPSLVGSSSPASARPAFASAEPAARPSGAVGIRETTSKPDQPSNFTIRPRPSEDQAEQERASALFNRRPAEPVEAATPSERPAQAAGIRPTSGGNPFNRGFTPAPRPSSNRALDSGRNASDDSSVDENQDAPSPEE